MRYKLTDLKEGQFIDAITERLKQKIPLYQADICINYFLTWNRFCMTLSRMFTRN
jgi:hypothetical protein